MYSLLAECCTFCKFHHAPPLITLYDHLWYKHGSNATYRMGYRKALKSQAAYQVLARGEAQDIDWCIRASARGTSRAFLGCTTWRSPLKLCVFYSLFSHIDS